MAFCIRGFSIIFLLVFISACTSRNPATNFSYTTIGKMPNKNYYGQRKGQVEEYEGNYFAKPAI